MNWIERQARKESVARLIISLVAIGLIGALLWSQERYYRNYWYGPYPLSAEELLGIQSPLMQEKYWVSLQADAIRDGDFEEITEHTKRGRVTRTEVTAHYYVADFGGRLLLVKAHKHKGVPVRQLEGYLKPISDVADRQFFELPEQQAIKSSFLPMVLDNQDFRPLGHLGLGAAGLTAAICLFYALLAGLRLNGLIVHPAVRSASAWGSINQVATKVENEVQDRKALRLRSYILTPEFIVRQGWFNFGLWRLDDVIWIYKTVKQRRIYYVIPAGKSYGLRFHTLHGEHDIGATEDKVEEAISFIQARKPWIIDGHSAQLEKLYKKDRKKMAADVAAARGRTQDQERWAKY